VEKIKREGPQNFETKVLVHRESQSFIFAILGETSCYSFRFCEL